jgi:hypothetical protein
MSPEMLNLASLICLPLLALAGLVYWLARGSNPQAEATAMSALAFIGWAFLDVLCMVTTVSLTVATYLSLLGDETLVGSPVLPVRVGDVVTAPRLMALLVGLMVWTVAHGVSKYTLMVIGALQRGEWRTELGSFLAAVARLLAFAVFYVVLAVYWDSTLLAVRFREMLSSDFDSPGVLIGDSESGAIWDGSPLMSLLRVVWPLVILIPALGTTSAWTRFRSAARSGAEQVPVQATSAMAEDESAQRGVDDESSPRSDADSQELIDELEMSRAEQEAMAAREARLRAEIRRYPSGLRNARPPTGPLHPVQDEDADDTPADDSDRPEGRECQ